MKKILVGIVIPFCVLVLFTGSAAQGESGGGQPLSPGELDYLLAPIALYPDPLIAQILPASTFTEEIAAAARFLERFGASAPVDAEKWDVSVKAVAHFPELLFMMDREYRWTVTLGQAFLRQPEDVLEAIQRLREQAYAKGNLRSTREQQVVVEGGYIRIVPADPVYIYLPQYDPEAVYYAPPDPGYPYLTFGVGFTIGAWLNRDCDWRGKRVYYHGWRDRGWVRRSRPHVQVRNTPYVSSGARRIAVDSGVSRRDDGGYREEIRAAREQRSRGNGGAGGTVYRARRGPQLRPPVETLTPAAPAGEEGRRQGPPPPQVGPAPQPQPAPSPPPVHAVPPGSRGR